MISDTLAMVGTTTNLSSVFFFQQQPTSNLESGRCFELRLETIHYNYTITPRLTQRKIISKSFPFLPGLTPVTTHTPSSTL